MPRKDIEFKTYDNVTLRGWLYTPSSSSGKLPCLVMAHGFSAVKEMDLDAFAEFFTSKLNLACIVYDNRGFGASDAKDGHPRSEINPHEQVSDYSDAITYAQTLSEVNGDKIGVWGSSYSGGHVLRVGAIDRRVKAVLCQVYAMLFPLEVDVSTDDRTGLLLLATEPSRVWSVAICGRRCFICSKMVMTIHIALAFV